MNMIWSIAKRELKGYFGSAVAYVFIVLFLILCGFFTFQVGRFYEARQANLNAFFVWVPWLYLFLVPAITMRLWSEERRNKTLEVLLTLPVTTWQAVFGKFLAAWIFIGIAVVLTFPMVFSVYYLGNPDFGPIATGYLGALFLAATYLAVGIFASAVSRSQIISFIIGLVLCLFFVLVGWQPVTSALQEYFPQIVVNFISSLSFNAHFDSIRIGVIDTRDIVYYVSFIAFMLCMTTAVLNNRRAN